MVPCGAGARPFCVALFALRTATRPASESWFIPVRCFSTVRVPSVFLSAGLVAAFFIRTIKNHELSLGAIEENADPPRWSSPPRPLVPKRRRTLRFRWRWKEGLGMYSSMSLRVRSHQLGGLSKGGAISFWRRRTVGKWAGAFLMLTSALFAISCHKVPSDPASAAKEAVRLYPALGVKDSTFNKTYLRL